MVDASILPVQFLWKSYKYIFLFETLSFKPSRAILINVAGIERVGYKQVDQYGKFKLI